jgi:hypothetical protein
MFVSAEIYNLIVCVAADAWYIEPEAINATDATKAAILQNLNFIFDSPHRWFRKQALADEQVES